MTHGLLIALGVICAVVGVVLLVLWYFARMMSDDH